MKIRCKYDKLVPVEDLKFHPKNRNIHTKAQIERLAQILDYQGWRYPVKVSNRSGFVPSGHGRILAAKLNKWKKVPVNFQDYDSDEQEYADVQADNAIARWAELDMAGINEDLGDLGPDFNIDMIGIKNLTIDVAEKQGKCGDDELPLRIEKRAKKGDIFKLGNHRLMCGTSTVHNSVEILFDGKKADTCFTSPPYNLGKTVGLRNSKFTKSAYTEFEDNQSPKEYFDFLKDFVEVAMRFSDIQFVNIQLLAGNKTALPEFWYYFKSNLIDMIIWDKEHGAPAGMTPRVLNSIFEFVFIFSSKTNPKKTIPNGPGFQGTMPNIFRLNPIGKKDELAKSHGAVFPVAFAEHFVKNFSNKIVYEPFSGSGTTLIACEKWSRKCYAMEIDPHYCDLTIARWEKFTGQVAKKL